MATQAADLRLTDAAPGCGSADLAAPNRGCYATTTNGFNFVCLPAASGTAGLLHGAEPHKNSAGTPFLNGCAPGHAPILLDRKTATNYCTAYCRPTATYLNHADHAAGIEPHDCQRLTGIATAECRYLTHLFEASDPSGRADALGYCIDYTRYDHDHDANLATANVPMPSCATLSSQPVRPGAGPEYLEFGCGPRE